MIFNHKLKDPKALVPLLINGANVNIKGTNTGELLKLIQLSETDLHSLRKIDTLMEEHAPIIAERHYNMIMNIPEIKKIFEKHSNKERYTTAIIKYYKQLTKPVLNEQYIQYRKKIGQIH